MKPTGLKRGKVDRKFGQKLFLKPFRGQTPKAAFTRRQYKPGAHGQSRVRSRSRSEEYRVQLMEKQKIRAVYGISDKVFKRIVRDAEARVQTADASQNVLDLITEALETRLDNVVHRGGLAPSRSMARQYISHGHILLNGRRNDIRSTTVRKGDIIAIRPQSREKGTFNELASTLKKYKAPKWLSVDDAKLAVTMVAPPNREEALGDLELAKVVEFYAR